MMRNLFISILILGLFMVAFTQDAQSVPPLQAATFAVSPVSSSGLEVSGTVYIADYGLGNTTLVVISLDGTAGMHPAHFHSGDCGSGGGIVVPLEGVDGATGLSTTVTTASADAILSGDHYLNIHASPEDMGTIVACGEVGQGAEATGSTSSATLGAADATPSEAGTATGVREEEFETSLPTASYGLFAVGGSGVSGQVQLTGQAEGGTRVVVSLEGTTPGLDYPMEIRSGDCGPDGAVVLELKSFPISSAEPGVGETQASLGFAELAEADNYLHVYAPDGSGTVLACGEVGVGANR